MQRQPEISDADYEAMLSRLEAAGFDPAIIRQVPHDWSREPERYETVTSINDSRPLAQ